MPKPSCPFRPFIQSSKARPEADLQEGRHVELRLLRPRRWDFLHAKATIDVSATQHTEQKRPMLLTALATSRLQHSALSRNDLCYCPQSLHQGCFSFHRFSCLSVPFAVPPIFVRSTAASMACFFRESLNLRILIELRLRAARRAVIGLPLPVRPSGFLKLEINNNVRTLAPLTPSISNGSAINEICRFAQHGSHGSDGRRAPAPRPGRLQVAAGSGWYRELWPVPGSGH